MNEACLRIASGVRDLLQTRNARIVLAESCTAGRVAASFGCLPGISEWFCGGFVVYRCASKSGWLGIAPQLLDDPSVGPVSPQVTELLARALLSHTPEARFAVSVTGDVGPGANVSTDGVIFVAFCDSRSQVLQHRTVRLVNPPPLSPMDVDARIARLDEATLAVLDAAHDWISMA